MLSMRGDGLGLAARMVQEGHDVSVYIQSPFFEAAGLGLVKKVSSWRPELKTAEFAICDAPGFGQYEKVFKEFNVPVFGCNYIGDMLDEDPAKTEELCEKFGIQIPQTWRLADPSTGVDVARDWNPAGMVIKARHEDGKTDTIVCYNKEVYFWALSRYTAEVRVSVQKRVVGTEVTVESWFNGVSWMNPSLLCFREYGDNSGVGSQEITGTAVVKKRRPPKIFKDTLEKITPFLKKACYRGPISANCIVNGSGVYVLGFNAKILYDSIEALAEGLKPSESLASLMYKVVTCGENEIDVVSDHLISVRLSTPNMMSKIDMPISGINDNNTKHLFPESMFRDEEGDYRFAGSSNTVAKITAYGRDMHEARNRVYRTINNIDFIDKRFDPSIGDRVEKDMRSLSGAGYV